MSIFLDPTWIAVMVTIGWFGARVIVFLGAAAVNLWSRNPARRAAARWLIRLVHGQRGEPAGDEPTAEEETSANGPGGRRAAGDAQKG